MAKPPGRVQAKEAAPDPSPPELVTECFICGGELSEEYQETLPEPSCFCRLHREVHRAAYPHMSEEHVADWVKLHRPFRDDFARSEKVFEEKATAGGIPTDCTEGTEFAVSVARTFGGYTRSEFGARFQKLMPEQLGMKPWTLFDEWGQQQKMVLTQDPRGAPRQVTISSAKTVQLEQFKIDRNNHIRHGAGDQTFDFLRSERQNEMKGLGCKVIEEEEIWERIQRRHEDGVEEPADAPRQAVAPASSEGTPAKPWPKAPSPPAAASLSAGSKRPSSKSLREFEMEQDRFTSAGIAAGHAGVYAAAQRPITPQDSASFEQQQGMQSEGGCP